MNREVTDEITKPDDNIKVITGAYEVETADQQKFCWFGKRVDIEVVSNGGLLILGGRSPLNGKVNITTPQVSFDVNLSTEQDMRLTIPVAPSGGKQQVVLEFNKALEVEADNRSLCFRAFHLQWQNLSRLSESGTTDIPLVGGRGLLSGQISTVFAMGWLRMTVKRTKQDVLCISGILVTPSQRREVAVLTANGKPLHGMKYGLFNPEYNYLGDVAFEGEMDLRPFYEVDHIRFSTAYLSDGSPATPWFQDWIYPVINSSLQLPEGENMRRIGSSEADWFLFSGASFVGKLPDILRQFSGNSRLQQINVLDWGCGCGRLTRHLLDMGCTDVTGIDIDPVNIAWCQDNLSDANFRLVSPDLPTTLLRQQYDLIVGHSIFTHLTELDQFLWLAEINRLLKPGGLAVVTIMGNFSAAIETFSQADFTALAKNGFLDVGWQEDGVDSQKPGYYRRIFHTTDYIAKNWKNYFALVSIMDGYSDHQTAVVLRKNG